VKPVRFHGEMSRSTTHENKRPLRRPQSCGSRVTFPRGVAEHEPFAAVERLVDELKHEPTPQETRGLHVALWIVVVDAQQEPQVVDGQKGAGPERRRPRAVLLALLQLDAHVATNVPGSTADLRPITGVIRTVQTLADAGYAGYCGRVDLIKRQSPRGVEGFTYVPRAQSLKVHP
jgi:hypothetical protein